MIHRSKVLSFLITVQGSRSELAGYVHYELGKLRSKQSELKHESAWQIRYLKCKWGQWKAGWRYGSFLHLHAFDQKIANKLDWIKKKKREKREQK